MKHQLYIVHNTLLPCFILESANNIKFYQMPCPTNQASTGDACLSLRVLIKGIASDQDGREGDHSAKMQCWHAASCPNFKKVLFLKYAAQSFQRFIVQEHRNPAGRDTKFVHQTEHLRVTKKLTVLRFWNWWTKVWVSMKIRNLKPVWGWWFLFRGASYSAAMWS